MHLPARRCRNVGQNEPQTEGSVRVYPVGMALGHSTYRGRVRPCARLHPRRAPLPRRPWPCPGPGGANRTRGPVPADDSRPGRVLICGLRRLGPRHNPRSHGWATVAPPSWANGKTREQATIMITGTNSCTSPEHTRECRRVNRKGTPEHPPRDVPRRAKAQVARCRHGGGTVRPQSRHDDARAPSRSRRRRKKFGASIVKSPGRASNPLQRFCQPGKITRPSRRRARASRRWRG